MLTKEQISFPMNFHDLPEIYGFVIDVGEHEGEPYTALWGKESDSNYPDYFWPNKTTEGFLIGFIEGRKEGLEAGYKTGRLAGISLVQNGLGMVFGPAAKNYVQQIVNEMDRDNAS